MLSLIENVNARAISDAILEKTGRSMMSGDFDTFVSCFFLPQEVETFEGTRWLLTPADVRGVFDMMRLKFAECGITDMVRRCVEAQFSGPETIEATHETRLLSKDQIIVGPYPCFSILQKIDGNWQVSHSQYAVADEVGQSTALLRSGSSKTRMREQA